MSDAETEGYRMSRAYKEQKMTDQELQALVLATGLMPCDRLPKKNPDQELKNFLTRVAVNINGAAKRGELFVQFSNRDTVAPVSKRLMNKATPILEQLGYKVESQRMESIEGNELVTVTYVVISGWGG